MDLGHALCFFADDGATAAVADSLEALGVPADYSKPAVLTVPRPRSAPPHLQAGVAVLRVLVLRAARMVPLSTLPHRTSKRGSLFCACWGFAWRAWCPRRLTHLTQTLLVVLITSLFLCFRGGDNNTAVRWN